MGSHESHAFLGTPGKNEVEKRRTPPDEPGAEDDPESTWL